MAQSTAGLVVQNSSLGADLQGTTGIAITYPIQGNYYNGTMGETAKSRLICYFDINERAVLANDITIQIANNVFSVGNFERVTQGEYYVLEDGEYKKVILPNDYEQGKDYYLPEYSEKFNTEFDIWTYNEDTDSYTSINWPIDYEPGVTYYYMEDGEMLPIPYGNFYERSDFKVDGEYQYKLVNIPYDMQLRKTYCYISGYSKESVDVYAVGEYFIKDKDGNYKSVILPRDWAKDTEYYSASYETIPYYKQVITRHRLSTTNKYENNSEMQTVNDGQSIDISLAVPSIRGSVINKIKDDMLKGLNIDKTYILRYVDESDVVIFDKMMPSGDFTNELVPGDTVIFKILFVYKR